MSLGISAATWAMVGAAVGAGVSIYNGQQQAKAADKAAKQADAAANAQEQANNRANAKRTDINALLSAAQQSGKSGVSGTMLTGPQGINPNSLSLGKSTLLGQ